MKNIVKIALISICLLLSLSGCGKKSVDRLESIKNKGVLIVATSPDYPPMEFIDTTKSNQEQYVGSDMALARYIADDLGVELKIEVMDFTAVLSSVSLGLADIAISGFGWREDREENFELSHGYNFNNESGCHGLLVLADKVDDYQSLEHFENKKIVAQSGSLQEGYVMDQIKNKQMELVLSLDVGLMMLQTKQVDAFALSCELAKAHATSNSDLMKASPEFVLSEKEINSGNVVAVKKGEIDFVNYLNGIIDQINADDSYSKWYSEAKSLALSLGIEFEK